MQSSVATSRSPASKLRQRQAQRTGDQAAQLQPIGGFVQRPGAVRDPGGRGKGVAGERAGLVGASEAAPRTAQAEPGRHRALQLPDEIGPGGDRARLQELPPPGQVPPPDRLCAHDRVDGHCEGEHDPEREVPVRAGCSRPPRARAPLDQPTPDSSVAATRVTRRAPAAVRRSQRAGCASRRHTRRSFQLKTAASAKPPAPCAAKTQASPCSPANRVITPVANSNPTSNAKPQSVDRGVTAPESVPSPAGLLRVRGLEARRPL